MKLIPINQAGEKPQVALVVEHPSELKVIYLLTNSSGQIWDNKDLKIDSFDVKIPLDAESFSMDIFDTVDRGLTYLKEKPRTSNYLKEKPRTFKGEEL